MTMFSRAGSRLALAAGLLFSVAATAQTVFRDGFEDAVAPITDAEAARFLAQATFGPTEADIAHLKAIGYQAWLDEQFAAQPSYQMDYIEWVRDDLHEQIAQGTRLEAWFVGALGGPDPENPIRIHIDQLRQRVAFALSEILVVSDQNTNLGLYGAEALAYYYDILVRNAFGNYRQLLQEVTLSPAMGMYLNMIGNRRADLSQNVHPDENYAREINQLFSIGLVMLNPDGTPVLDGGVPVPTYGQAQITAFAQVFTGWNFAHCNDIQLNFVNCIPWWTYPEDWLTPMVPVAAYHDNGTGPDDGGAKQLLLYPGAANGGLLPIGGTPQSDLAFALDNIYNHPNVGPFIVKQLIQRLVTSNPSPPYVQRVANVFNAYRTDPAQLKHVVAAILLDSEARNGHVHPATVESFGKVREPLLVLTHLWRSMGARHVCGTNTVGAQYDNPYRYAGYLTGWGVGGTQWQGIAQAPLDSPTVFNFFKPSFMPSGEMADNGWVAPELELETDAIIALTVNSLVGIYTRYDLEFVQCDTTPGVQYGEVAIDLSRDYALAGSANGGPGDPGDALVDAYNLRYLSGQMSPFMRTTLLNYLNQINSSWSQSGEDWRWYRVHRALSLVLTSPEYMVQK